MLLARIAMVAVLLAGCAHVNLNACTPDPTLNDEPPQVCLDLYTEDPSVRMCAWGDAESVVYIYRLGCYGEWYEESPDVEPEHTL